MQRSSTQRKTGVFGGTFDPVHAGHVAVARAAFRALGLDELLWVPALPWQKTACAKASDRLAMLERVLAKLPGHAIETVEIDGAGPSYTCDTLASLQRRRPHDRLYLVVGSDQFANFLTWKNPSAILAMAEVAVCPRKGGPAAGPGVLEAFAKAAKAPIVLEGDYPEVSSSEIRLAVAENRLGDLAGLLDPDVLAYIDEHNLYH